MGHFDVLSTTAGSIRETKDRHYRKHPNRLSAYPLLKSLRHSPPLWRIPSPSSQCNIYRTFYKLKNSCAKAHSS